MWMRLNGRIPGARRQGTVGPWRLLEPGSANHRWAFLRSRPTNGTGVGSGVREGIRR